MTPCSLNPLTPSAKHRRRGHLLSIPRANCYTAFEIARYGAATAFPSRFRDGSSREPCRIRPPCRREVLHGSAGTYFQKHNRNWYMRLADFYVPNTIQLQDIGFGISAQCRGVVEWIGACTRVVGAPHGERQLERRRLERERQCPGRQQVERRQPGLLSQLLLFSPDVTSGEFYFQCLSSIPRPFCRLLQGS